MPPNVLSVQKNNLKSPQSHGNMEKQLFQEPPKEQSGVIPLHVLDISASVESLSIFIILQKENLGLSQKKEKKSELLGN